MLGLEARTLSMLAQHSAHRVASPDILTMIFMIENPFRWRPNQHPPWATQATELDPQTSGWTMFRADSTLYHFVTDSESSGSPQVVFLYNVCISYFLCVTGIKVPKPKEMFRRFYFALGRVS